MQIGEISMIEVSFLPILIKDQKRWSHGAILQLTALTISLVLLVLLQMQLEQIRAAEQEVRWQHEEDVEECNNCKEAFTLVRRKVREKMKHSVPDIQYIIVQSLRGDAV